MIAVITHSLFKIFYLFFKGKEREGEREGEEHECVVDSRAPPTGGPACNPGMCPDWESKLDPLVLRLPLRPLSHTNQVLLHIIDMYNHCHIYHWVCFLLVFIAKFGSARRRHAHTEAKCIPLKSKESKLLSLGNYSSTK